MTKSRKVEFLNTKSGGYLVFAKDFDIADRLRKDGVHDREVIETGFSLLQEDGWGPGKGGTLIDAGAHLGTFSIPLAVKFGLTVQAFEAQREVAQLLGANYQLNSISEAWVHNIALGATDGPGHVDIPRADYTQPGNSGAFSVDPEISRDRSAVRLRLTDQTERVPLRSIDSFAFTEVALIKIDVEGQELAVLEGAVETLRVNGLPPILFECWQGEDYRDLRMQTMAFVEGLGYDLREFGENIAAQRK